MPRVSPMVVSRRLHLTKSLPPRAHFFLESVSIRVANYTFSLNLDAVIVSPGGVASTALMEYVGQFVHVNSPGDRDTLKHRPKPPRHPAKQIPALLITGDSD